MTVNKSILFMYFSVRQRCRTVY